MNGHAGIDTFVATEHLKNILNVGKGDSGSGKMKNTSNGIMESTVEGNLSLNDGSYQKIELGVNKDANDHGVYGIETDIYSSPLEYGTTCSKVMVENIVDYGWEEKYYYGKLVNIHISGLYFAYVLKPPNNKPGFVRIIRPSLSLRHLIKDYKNEVKDIAFAHTTSQVLLGSVDACGELLIHKITDDESSILCSLVIRILRPADWVFSEYNRIIWCLYIPDVNENDEVDNSNEDIASLLVVTHNEKVEVWNIETILKEHGQGNLTTDEVRHGLQIINEHKLPITAAIFAPDGTALAIASLDGVINFFQVNFADNGITPRCLHKWEPHKGKPLSSFYFLDNHKNHRPEDQFWKYAVTGAENNTEIKLWSCESWKCLQTLRIHPNSNDSVEPSLKAEMDYSSKYLFLSDIKRKVILIFLIHQDPVSGTPTICSLSEYKISLPVLSFVVTNVRNTKSDSLSEEKNSDDEEMEEDEQMDDTSDKDKPFKYILKLYWIQTKALQSCKIYFHPKVEALTYADSASSLSQDSYVFKDGLSDISLDIRDSSSRSGKELDISMQKSLGIADELSIGSQSSSTRTSLPSHIPAFSNCSEVLLTPDDFTSPSHSTLPTSAAFSHTDDIKCTASKCDTVSRLSEGIEILPVEPTTIIRRKSSQHSATSSPSREVAEILGPIKMLNLEEISSDNSAMLNTNEETLSDALNNFNNLSGSAGIPRNQQETHIKDWPQAPDHTKNFRICGINDSELLGPLHFQTDNSESANISLDLDSKFIKFSHNMDDLLLKMKSLSEAVHDQSCDIQALQTQIKMLREDQMLNKQNSDENVLSTRLEQSVSQIVASQYNRLENLILTKTEEKYKKIERELLNISNGITTSFGSSLDNTIKKELSHQVIPQLNKVVESVAQKNQLEFNQKLGQTDASLRESFSKHLKGKPFIDTVTQAVSNGVQVTVQNVCKELFQNVVVPSFNKASQHQFQQLNDIFCRGTNEYLQAFEKCSQQACGSLESYASSLKEDMAKFMSEAQQALHAQTLKTEAHNADMIKQHDALLNSIRQIVEEETRKILREQQTAVLNSRSVTPVPSHTDPQFIRQQLLQLVRQGNINDAFQTALSAMDVQVVLFLCETVNCDHIFGAVPCPLQQHVLLSLLNQLTSDLNTKTEVKVKYIEEIIACLDSEDPIIKDHIQGVLKLAKERIGNFSSKNPTHKLARCLKRISLAIQSFIK